MNSNDKVTTLNGDFSNVDQIENADMVNLDEQNKPNEIPQQISEAFIQSRENNKKDKYEYIPYNLLKTAMKSKELDKQFPLSDKKLQ